MNNLMTLDELRLLNPALAHHKIRIHKLTQKASVLDLTRLVTGKTSNHAGQTLKTLSPELVEKMDQLKINGKGRPTWVADAQTCVEIIWELPGKQAKSFRRQCAHLITRILGGDATLIAEMEKRVVTTSPEQREFMLTRPVSPVPTSPEEQVISLKRKRLEVDMMEHELAERKVKMKREIEEHQLKHNQETAQHKLQLKRDIFEIAETGLCTMKRLFGDDSHIKAAFKDFAMQALSQSSSSSFASMISEYAPDISQLAASMGFSSVKNGNLSQIGRLLAKKYRTTHGGTSPEKTTKYCNGAVRHVNAYKQVDVPLMQECIREVLNKITA